MGLCGGFSTEVRAKKMRQDGRAEFISDSYSPIIYETIMPADGKIHTLLSRAAMQMHVHREGESADARRSVPRLSRYW